WPVTFFLWPRRQNRLSRKLKRAILRRVKFPEWSPVAKTSQLILAAVIVLAGNAPAASPRSMNLSERFEVLPLTRSWQNHLMVHAQINGKPAVLMVDSGAPATLISLKRRADFRLDRVGTNSDLPSSVVVNGVPDKLAIVHNLRLGAL